MIFYTYLWLRADGSPSYVGKGTGSRAYVQRGHRINKPDDSYILVQEHLTEEQAFAAEKFLIAYYGRIDLGTGCLANLTDGGDTGPSHKGLKRKPFSAEHRRKLSVASSGNKHLLGHRHSADTRCRLTIARNRRSAASADTRRKMSESQRNRWTKRREE